MGDISKRNVDLQDIPNRGILGFWMGFFRVESTSHPSLNKVKDDVGWWWTIGTMMEWWEHWQNDKKRCEQWKNDVQNDGNHDKTMGRGKFKPFIGLKKLI